MSNVDAPKLSLNVVTNKEKTKVLFAEANRDFVNVLLSFLALPLGKVVSILRKHYGEAAAAIGSLNTLDDTYFCVGGAKQMLLNPQSSLGVKCRKLAFDITDFPNRCFICQDQKCLKLKWKNVSMYSDIAKCECGKPLNKEIRVGECVDGGGAFITSLSSFFITDDLTVAPMTGIIQILNNLGIAGIEVADVENVSIGINEIRDLLKLSLTSETPLTDVIIKKNQIIYTAANCDPLILLPRIQKGDANSRKVVLKACLQKSKNKFLFAIATDEFVELLFSFLTVALGGVDFFLGGNTGLKKIDNLYRSVSKGIDEKYFLTPDTKEMLINPKLPHGYNSSKQFLPFSEEAPPNLYYQNNWINGRYYYSFHEKGAEFVSSFKSSKDLFIKKQTITTRNQAIHYSTRTTHFLKNCSL